jgi:Hemerythrin HHE cation binding domain
MNRYNVFYQIHKALRTLLYDTGTRLQQTDFINTGERNAAISRLIQVIVLFESHAHTEDTFILPVLEQYEPSVTTLFADEHVQDHQLGERLNSLLSQIRKTSSADELIRLGSSINKAFTEFLVFNLNHMAKEEIVLNELLWRYYSDEEIHGITEKILAHIEPQFLQLASFWMVKSLSNNEIIFWLQQIRGTVPQQAFDGLIYLINTELPDNRSIVILESLSEGAMAE